MQEAQALSNVPFRAQIRVAASERFDFQVYGFTYTLLKKASTDAYGRGVVMQCGTTRARSMALNGPKKGWAASDTAYGEKTKGPSFN